MAAAMDYPEAGDRLEDGLGRATAHLPAGGSYVVIPVINGSAK
jgi:hypothetical protein